VRSRQTALLTFKEANHLQPEPDKWPTFLLDHAAVYFLIQLILPRLIKEDSRNCAARRLIFMLTRTVTYPIHNQKNPIHAMSYCFFEVHFIAHQSHSVCTGKTV
jgi:hypothetical protein